MADTDIQTQPAPPQYTPTADETGAFQALKTGPMKAIIDPFERLYKQSQQSGLEAATAKREQEKTLASGKANAAAELYSGMQTRMSEMDKMAPPPKMNITPDTHEGLMGLATILPIAGILLGSKGMMSGVNAMNAMTGVMKGYQEGNKARIDFEKQKYDTSMKEWEANYKVSRQKLADAIDMMKTNYQAGVAKAEAAAVEMGPEPAALLRQSGAAFLLNKLDEANKHVLAAQDKLAQSDIVAQRQEAVARAKKVETVSGQYGRLQSWIGEDAASKIGSTEIPIVTSKVESSKETKDLADLIRANPQAAGIAGRTISWLDKFIPSRYDTNTQYDPTRLETAAQNDPELFQGIPADKISAARIIQKKVIDVINARAKAVSNRLLVSELRMQKDALDIAGLSPESAAALYDSVARSDIETLRQYMPPETLNILKNKAGVGVAAAPSGGLPTEAVKRLKEGQVTTFSNGQSWTLENGQPVRVNE